MQVNKKDVIEKYDDQLDKLLKQRKQLDARMNQIKRSKSTEQRKRRNHNNIVAGSKIEEAYRDWIAKTRNVSRNSLQYEDYSLTEQRLEIIFSYLLESGALTRSFELTTNIQDQQPQIDVQEQQKNEFQNEFENAFQNSFDSWENNQNNNY